MSILKIMAVCSIVLLAACSGKGKVHKFNDDSYLTASSVHPMEIPADLKSTSYIEPYYPAPEGAYPAPGAEPVSLLPPEMGDLLKTEETKK